MSADAAYDGNGNTLKWRVGRLETEADEIRRVAEAAGTATARHEEQINGAGGVVKAVNAIGAEVKSLRRAIYTVGGGILLAAVTALFTLAGHG